MRICFLSSGHPIHDKRVFDKEATSLAAAGFEVVYLTAGEEGSTRDQGVEVITYMLHPSILGRLFQIPRLYRLGSRLNADCYHCNEVDSWIAGVFLKLLRRRKIVFDVHEDYPSTFAESRFPRPLRPLVAGIIRLLYRALAPLTDRFVLAKHCIAHDFRHAQSKVLVVANYTPLTYADRQPPPPDARPWGNSGLTAIHLGLIGRLRGWPQLLEALARARNKSIHLHVIGTFNDDSRADFGRRVAELGLQDRVTFEEWLPFAEAYERVLASDIGLVLFQPGVQNHVYALPHKMFDYMMSRLPVIAPAFAEEVAAIIREADCGLLIDPSDPEQIAQALDRLADDPDERRRLGENGRRAVRERYNWEAEAAKLVGMYRELAGVKP